MNIYRQGDVLLVRVDSLPAGSKQERGPIILAHGEVTGHAHRVRSRSAKLFADSGKRFLAVTKAVDVVHEEHDTVTLEPGVYEVKRQVEYTPEEIRQVAD